MYSSPDVFTVFRNAKMFIENDLTSVFQMEILRQVRTGNPIIDAILFSCLTYFISKLFHGSYFKKLKEWWFAKVKDDRRIIYTIERKQPGDSTETWVGDEKVIQEKNKLYHALTWFLRHEKCITDYSKTYKVVVKSFSNEDEDKDDYDEDLYLESTECIMIPTANITIEYDGLVIDGEYDYKEDEKGNEIEDKFVLTVDKESAPKIEKFFDMVLKKYIKHEQHLKKGHKLFSLIPYDYGGSRLFWASSVFKSHASLSNVILKDRKEIELCVLQ